MDRHEIIEFRQRLGLTQEQFASKLGTTVGSVNKWENGKSKPSRLYIKEIKQMRDKLWK